MSFNVSEFEKTLWAESRQALAEGVSRLGEGEVWALGFDHAPDYSHLFAFVRSEGGVESAVRALEEMDDPDARREGARMVVLASRFFPEHLALESSLPKTERLLERFARRLASARARLEREGDEGPMEELLSQMRSSVERALHRLQEELDAPAAWAWVCVESPAEDEPAD